MWARRSTVCEPCRPLEAQRVNVSETIQCESAVAVPRWLVWSLCFLARPLVRVGLWLSVTPLRCSAKWSRFSLTQTAVATGLLSVNICAAAVGTTLGWLSKTLALATRLSTSSRKCRSSGLARREPYNAVTAGPRIYATDLHDGWEY